MEANLKMNEKDILPKMVRDHCKIEQLLNDLEEKIDGDYESMRECFNKFEWELEKHLFTEEKAIFTLYNPAEVSEGYKMLPELTKQHNVLVNQLNNWREEIRKKQKISGFYDFKIYLTKHKLFEEKEVYPRLDETLNDKQKQLIIDRINEMV